MIVKPYLNDFNPIRYVFGSDYTIYYRMCEWGGNEIHVDSKRPIRKIATDVMNSIGGVWWTGVPVDNRMAINRCLKGGFTFHSAVTKTNPYNDRVVTMNIYKRC